MFFFYHHPSNPGVTLKPGLKVIGKFSIRTVPDQDPEQIVSLTEGYLRRLWSQRGSPNKMSVRGEGERGWLADTNTVNFRAAARFGQGV